MKVASLIVASLLPACDQSGEDIIQDPYVPPLEMPRRITVTEGGTTTFVIGLAASATEGIDATFFFVNTDKLVVQPRRLWLSLSHLERITSEMFTIIANADEDALDEQVHIVFNVSAVVGTPTLDVRIVDLQAPNYLVRPWHVVVPASGSATLEFQLTQPPAAPINVELSSRDASHVTITPSTLGFDSSNYNVPQMITVTRLDGLYLDRGVIDVAAAGEFPAALISVAQPYSEVGLP